MSCSVFGDRASAALQLLDARLRLGDVGVSRSLQQLLEFGLVALQRRRAAITLDCAAWRCD
jgi:hypothetical protein